MEYLVIWMLVLSIGFNLVMWSRLKYKSEAIKLLKEHNEWFRDRYFRR